VAWEGGVPTTGKAAQSTVPRSRANLGCARPRALARVGAGSIFGHRVRVWVGKPTESRNRQVGGAPATAPCSDWNLGFWVAAPRVSGRVGGREKDSYSMLEG
jgi:hypothetical protein